MILAGEADIPVHSIRSQIASGLDLVVFLRRYKDGVRRIESIEEIDSLQDGYISTRLLYGYSKSSGFMKVNEVSDTWKFETNV
jgi:pilus assembly protein CpaF